MNDVSTNPTRRLGKTGLMVTALGFGGIPIQLATEDDAVETVRRAFNLGINFFDTARGYSTSEERIGKALEGCDYIVATKSGTRDAEGIYQDVCISLEKLRRDRIDVYQVHGLGDEADLKGVLGPGGALEGLKRAQRDGKIAHIGITGHTRETLVQAVEMCDEFATVQVPFNLVEDEALQQLIPLCKQKDVGVIAMKPAGGGNFTNASLAVKWCVNQPVSTAIPGMGTIAEVEENVAAAKGVITFSADELATIEQMKSELDKRTCRRCRYCEPCPQKVQITMLMHGRSVIRRMGVEAYKNWGAKEMIAGAANCEDCGLCITKCPYDLSIPELIRENVEFYKTFPELKE